MVSGRRFIFLPIDDQHAAMDEVSTQTYSEFSDIKANELQWVCIPVISCFKVQSRQASDIEWIVILFDETLQESCDFFSFFCSNIRAEPAVEFSHRIFGLFLRIHEEKFNVLKKKESAVGEVRLLWDFDDDFIKLVLAQVTGGSAWMLCYVFTLEIAA